MKTPKIQALLVCILFLAILLFILLRIHTKTVTYYLSDDPNTYYQKTYFSFSNSIEIALDEPSYYVTDNDNIFFNGWYYDSILQHKAESPLKLADDLTLYASWIEDNPNSDFLLPEIHISSETSIENINDLEYEVCLFSLTNTNTSFCIQQCNAQIAGRGNSTWRNFDKKPYKIKFEEKQDLFGFGFDRNWVLLSNSVDYTLLRNSIALELGQIFELDYTPQCQWVQLYYNENYQGLYLLCEAVETGINRVDIEVPYEPDELFISYFLEFGGFLDSFSISPVDSATTNWGEYFSCDILYPQSNLISKHQKEYIDAYVHLVNEAILTQNWKEITELVDINSFVDWYLINEIMLNADMGWSMFAYMPAGGKLHLGPIWDFDQSCGISTTGGARYNTWQTDSGSQNAWFNSLIEMDEFKQLLAERWTAKLPDIQMLLAEQESKTFTYSKDIAANYIRWPVIGTMSWGIREEIGKFETYQENVNFLFNWLDKRINWLNQELSDY